MHMSNHPLAKLPPSVDLETKSVLKALVNARSLLAKFNGILAGLANRIIMSIIHCGVYWKRRERCDENPQ